jgi:hydroxymethylpyrimidine pyrophosphatase-like HAD family hydrolase
MPLRAVYTDLDGTMLGPMGNLFAAPDGSFSKAQTLGLEACHRAGVEVVIMSGRREAQVLSDSRLMGQASYIYEAGCGVVIDREKTLLTGDWSYNEEGGPAEQMIAAGIPDRLFEHFGPKLEWHDPWHIGRELSLLFRGLVDVGEANEVVRGAGHDNLRFLDNGAIRTTVPGIEVAHAYHLVPRGASKREGVAFHMQARGYAPDEAIGVGDSIEDIEVAGVVGRFFVVANGPERDPGVRDAIRGRANVTVTEGEMGDGFYEAVISSLR